MDGAALDCSGARRCNSTGHSLSKQQRLRKHIHVKNCFQGSAFSILMVCIVDGYKLKVMRSMHIYIYEYHTPAIWPEDCDSNLCEQRYLPRVGF